MRSIFIQSIYMEELYNQLMDLKEKEKHINKHHLSFMVFCEYRKKQSQKKQYILSYYLPVDICEMIISYISLCSSFGEVIEYESADEKKVHKRILAQIDSWDHMRIIADNIYPQLFIDDINRLAEDDYRVTVRYDDLNIIHDTTINIILPERQSYEPPTTRFLSLYNYNTKYTLPIIGIGRQINDPTTILILVMEWDPIERWWKGLLYRQTSYITKLHNLYPEDWQTISDRLNDLGVFYVI